MRKYTLLLLFCLVQNFIAYSQTKTPLVITAANATFSSFTDKEVTINGKTDLHITASANVLNNSVINLNSADSWVFFDNIRPQYVIDSLLRYVSVNGLPATYKTNTRVSIYKQGAVLIPQSTSFKPLTVFTGKNFTGDSATYSLFTFYNSLGAFDNNIRSFKLKRGYMATLANTSDGTGYSRVFIADDKDLEISVLPYLLDSTISFIRVFDWEWVSKKGWAGSDFNQYSKVKATWRYDWSAGGSTSPYVEYVPIRQNGGWPGWSEINGKQYATHVLGFNEPDHTEQSNLTVAQAVAQWPDMLRTGLRVGSPACTNFSWLYQFMDSCNAHSYRVDYVAVHAYWGGKSPANWYNDLKYIHDRTGRPIWITEWNNGANWTSEYWPTSDHSLSAANAAKQLSDLKGILTVLDTASFIERYSIYNWVQDCRAMVLGDTLTPAGKYYAADNSVMAFNHAYEVIPTYGFSDPSLSIAFSTRKLSLSISDPNADFFRGFILEKKMDDGNFTELYRMENTSTKQYADTLDLNAASRTRYRTKSIYNNGTISGYTNEVGYDVTEGADIQFGKLTYSNAGWNPVYFKKPYSAIPSIIIGSPTNSNSTVYLSARAKLISYSSRFNVQLAPWTYQNVSTLSKDESVPYFVIKAGNYDFGGLKAIAGKTTVASTWTSVTFSTPFDTIPVVFINQLSPSINDATTARVRNVTKTGFEACIQKETAVKLTLNPETVTYFAITPGTGLINSKKVIVGRSADNAIKTTTYATVNFGDSIGNPVFISQMQTCNDDTVTATMRCLSITSKFANLIKQREKSTGVTTAANETAGWMVIDNQSVVQALHTPAMAQLRFYPNPVNNYLYYEQSGAENLTIEIRNMYGVLVKRVVSDNHKIDVSDLESGCYVVKASNHIAAKFIKL